MAVIVTLGAAIGVPIDVPEHGMLPAAIVLAVAIVYQRGIGLLSFKHRRIELLTQGDLIVLVRDGILNLSRMRGSGLSRERVFAALREKGVEQLGEVRRMYFETSGAFSLYTTRSPVPGLRIVPADHPGLEPKRDVAACASCGALVDKGQQPRRCPLCDCEVWAEAVQAAKPG